MLIIIQRLKKKNYFIIRIFLPLLITFIATNPGSFEMCDVGILLSYKTVNIMQCFVFFKLSTFLHQT